MSEVSARQKLACPACGAEAQWNPAKQALVCPFCGTTSPMAQPGSAGNGTAGATTAELDLVTALRGITADQRGWQAEKRTVRCQSCQAISVFDPARVSQRCEFCGSTALIPVDEQSAPIRPESLLEIKIAESDVRDLARKWYGSRWFAPNKLKGKALTDTLYGAYLPYWTFDAQVHAGWTAEAGHYYYTTESYQDAQGRQQTRQVQHTRWVPAAGELDHFFDDQLVTGSRGVPEALLRQIEPFPTTTDLKPYDPQFLSGWVVEQYQIDLVAAAKTARDRMDRALEQLCAAEVPGDTQRNLQVSADYSAQTFKHILVPVWVIAYTYGATSYQMVINGYTGKMAGKYPLSWVKISLLVLLVLTILAVWFAYAQR